MPIPELGQPDGSFHDLWEVHDEELESLPQIHGGFRKWTVEKPAHVRRATGEEIFYCKEAQVHFTGELLDGTQFVSSRENGIPQRFILGQENVMVGFSFAVSSMQPGEKAIFTIPPELAVTKFGSPASIPSHIPPNQTLRFEIELIALFTITDIFEDEGLLKKIINSGVSNRERSSSSDMDSVYVKYDACLKDGTSVSRSEGVEFSLADGYFCPAFAHAVRTMKGEEAILIVNPKCFYVDLKNIDRGPLNDAFGEQGRPSQGDEASAPPNANLYVYLQFVSWIRHVGLDRTIIKKTICRGNSPGMGAHSQAVVEVRLLGRLQDGTVFDRRGHGNDEPFKFVVDEGHVIDGLDEAVMTMEMGEVAEFTINPPHHAFGAVGSDQQQPAVVPPNSVVIYDIELLSVVHVLSYDEANMEARQQQITMEQKFPEESPRVDTEAMYRGFELYPPGFKSMYDLDAVFTPASYSPRKKREHRYRGGVFLVPGIAPKEGTNANQAPTTTPLPGISAPPTPTTSVTVNSTSSQSSPTTSVTVNSTSSQSSEKIRAGRGFLFRCFGSSPA